MSETKIQNGGGTVPCVQAEGTETAEQISKSENKIVYHDCDGSVQFGSYYPRGSEYYWYGIGPILRGEN